MTDNPNAGEAQSAANMSDDEVNARIQGLDFTAPTADDFESDEAAEGAAAAALGADNSALTAAKAEAAKNLEDYQRSQADYINLRNRTNKQLETARADGREDVLRALMPVLDQIERARSHNELEGPMVAIAQQIDDILGRLGFKRFGAVGDDFDPNMHEALMHRTDPEAAGEKVEHVIDPGYSNGDKVVRPAKVGVVSSE